MREKFDTLLAEIDGPVAQVQLNTPGTGNSISLSVLDELLEVLDAVQQRPEVRALVLSGAGEHFCTGGDRHEYADLIAQDPSGAVIGALADRARRVCEALSTSHAVTIARLHGQVVGAGLALALFCDLRAGADTCRFRMPEIALGLPAVWGGALPRLMQEAGAARIRELILTGNGFDAATAQQMSVLHRAVPEEELDRVLQAWTRPLLRRSAVALRVTKTVLNSYAATTRLADATLLEGDLLASVLAAGHHARAASPS